jgi:DNA-binding response OmpR family regulator
MKKKIMLVDDNPDFLLSVQKALQFMDENYEVICASSGIRCLSLLNENEIPDIILLDIMMPKMTGWETFKNLQENPQWKDIPVIFLTARTDDTAKKTGSFLAADYIEKPFKIEELKNRIDKILKK